MTGSEWCNLVRNLPRLPDREAAIFGAVAAGEMPDFGSSTINLGDRAICVANDYLAIGDVDDFVRVPVSGGLALTICELVGATTGRRYRCPTKSEVDAVWAAADVKLEPRPLGPPYDSTMLTVERFELEDRLTEDERRGRRGLIAGHRKDILGLTADRRHVVIYGWEHINGVPIQGVNDFSHEASYADYSHGLRLVFDAD